MKGRGILLILVAFMNCKHLLSQVLFQELKGSGLYKGRAPNGRKFIFLKNSFLADKHSGDLQKSLLSKYEGNRLQVFAWRFAFLKHVENTHINL